MSRQFVIKLGVYLLALFMLTPTWILLHESAHWVTVVLTGGTPLLFRPYPEIVRGEFFLGRTVFRGGDTNLIVLAPYILDSVLFYPIYRVANWVRDSPWFLALLAVLTCPIVNTGVALLCDPTDFSEIHRYYSMLFLLILYTYVIFFRELISPKGGNRG